MEEVGDSGTGGGGGGATARRPTAVVRVAPLARRPSPGLGRQAPAALGNRALWGHLPQCNNRVLGTGGRTALRVAAQESEGVVERKDIRLIGPGEIAAGRRESYMGDISPFKIAEEVGLGTWELRGALDLKLEVAAAQVEALLRDVLHEELSGAAVDSSHKYADSLEMQLPEEELARLEKEGRAVPDPLKGEPGYPRFTIENRVYYSNVFRKIHMELAVRQDGMQVFHFVMYPWPAFDVPIFSLDMVSFNGNLTLAICDCCPVSADMSLPSIYQQGLAAIQQEFSVDRKVPDWGEAIFSKQCVLVRPDSAIEVGAFIKYTLSALSLHLQISRLVAPLPKEEMPRMEGIWQAHQRYSHKMLENDKTARALEASFGKEWSAEYMRRMMFDSADPDIWESLMLLPRYAPDAAAARAEVEAMRAAAEEERRRAREAAVAAAKAKAEAQVAARVGQAAGSDAAEAVEAQASAGMTQAEPEAAEARSTWPPSDWRSTPSAN
mmetsp:Transcript_46502/g.116296  ORF Transcript_46502/g.116296 Transcript_46502/m.116296 type:complete len:495 (+) Transcript_46502:432-1916(+)